MNYWSNPQVVYDGSPVGIDPASPNSAANFTQQHCQIVAAYRQSVPAGGGSAAVQARPLSRSTPTRRARTRPPPIRPRQPSSLNTTFDTRSYVEAGYDFSIPRRRYN